MTAQQSAGVLSRAIVVAFGINMLRALPVFVLELYKQMVLIFAQLVCMLLGYQGAKNLLWKRLAVYVVGTLATVISDLYTISNSARSLIVRGVPANGIERHYAPVFWAYFAIVLLLSFLNLFGIFHAIIVANMARAMEREADPVKRLKSLGSQSSVAVVASQARRVDFHGDGQQDQQKHQKHAGNEVVTSKYSVLTFLPLVLYYQFSRLANLYTLGIVVLSCFSFSPVSPVSSISPLAFVLGVSVIKEFFEDRKRHVSDAAINSRRVLIYRPPTDSSHNTNSSSSGGVSAFFRTWFTPSRRHEDDETAGLLSSSSSGSGHSPSTVTATPTVAGHHAPTAQRPTASTGDAKDVTEGVFRQGAWRDVRVGDVLMVCDGEALPADVLLLMSSSAEGRCYLETSNLDGETNLKARTVACPQQPYLSTPRDLATLTCVLECDGPSPAVYEFNGVLTVTGGASSSRVAKSLSDAPNQQQQVTARVGPDNLLLRGTTLKNTRWAVGVVVYAGRETKVEQNKMKVPHKMTALERLVNSRLIWVFVLQTFMCLVSSVGSNGFSLHSRGLTAVPWYLAPLGVAPRFIYVSYVILSNTMIPLSMYVSMEMVKVVNARFIDSDLKMYRAETDTPSQARNTSINEELGRIQYVVSDKTGTLTCNEMKFAKCSVGGSLYHCEGVVGAADATATKSKSLAALTAAASSGSNTERNFLVLLALCNTVIPTASPANPAQVVYESTSPDEEALVGAASAMGVSLLSRTASGVTVSVFGAAEEYRVLHVLEFNSYRKRMSVLLQRVTDDDSGGVLLLCKGADSVVMSRVAAHCDGAVKAATNDHLSLFASDGYRTLAMGMRTVGREEYEQWAARYERARATLGATQHDLDSLADDIEHSLTLLGSTAIEDRLQDGVPQCVADLREAGIKVWVLTGDKRETAVSVGMASRVLRKGEQLVTIADTTQEGVGASIQQATEEHSVTSARNLVRQIQDAVTPRYHSHSHPPHESRNRSYSHSSQQQNSTSFSLVIEGHSLEHALHPDLCYEFLLLAKAARSVICCRATPLQKARVVKLVSERSLLWGDGAITLAIGDGANDVPMIQRAHVGVGISGREGMQAVLASDFAIPQFAMLRRLLFVHGTRSYSRVSKLVLYSFAKNMALCVSQFWFGFYQNFSGQLSYFDFLFTLFNALFTALPILSIAMLDQDETDTQLESSPRLYKRTQANQPFSASRFSGYIVLGVWQSLTVFFIPFFGLGVSEVDPSGQAVGLWSVGLIAYTCLVLTATAQAGLMTSRWTKANVLAVLLSMLAFFVFISLYCSVPDGLLPVPFGVFWTIAKMPMFWLQIPLVCAIGVLPHVLWLAWPKFWQGSARGNRFYELLGCAHG